jgi:hypothetical protein
MAFAGRSWVVTNWLGPQITQGGPLGRLVWYLSETLFDTPQIALGNLGLMGVFESTLSA